jgi:hypothetical protein
VKGSSVATTSMFARFAFSVWHANFVHISESVCHRHSLISAGDLLITARMLLCRFVARTLQGPLFSMDIGGNGG